MGRVARAMVGWNTGKKWSKPLAEIVYEEAAKCGIPIDKKLDITEILWNETGYPCFWDGDPETCLRQQLHDFFIKLKK